VTTEVAQGDAVEGDYSLHVTVNAIGANSWNTGLQQGGRVFEAGKSYTVSAFLKSQAPTLDFTLKPELRVDPWTAYGNQTFTMTDEWAQYSTSTGVIPQDVDPAGVTFQIGFAVGEFWIDDVMIYEEN